MSNSSFLFSVTNNHKLELRKTDSPIAVEHSRNSGPIFGEGIDLCVGNNANNNRNNNTWAYIGSSYQK